MGNCPKAWWLESVLSWASCARESGGWENIPGKCAYLVGLKPRVRVCVCVCVKLWVHWGASSGWGEYILGGMHGGRVQVSEEVVGMISD